MGEMEDIETDAALQSIGAILLSYFRGARRSGGSVRESIYVAASALVGLSANPGEEDEDT